MFFFRVSCSAGAPGSPHFGHAESQSARHRLKVHLDSTNVPASKEKWPKLRWSWEMALSGL